MTVVIPPLPPPSSIKDTIVQVTVDIDPYGHPVKGSVQITGLHDSDYAHRLASAVEKTKFSPAYLDGCAVVGTTHLTIHFAR